MEKNLIQVPAYIFGEMRYSPSYLRRIIYDINGQPMLEIHDVDHWGLKAAIKNASKIQEHLWRIPLQQIVSLLAQTMDNYFAEDGKYETIVKLTGSPLDFVKGGIEFVKDWARNMETFLAHALNEPNVVYKSTSPVVAILPSNSEQESLYVLAQTILSRNATILRPSSLGASSYTALEFIYALNRTLDGLNKPELEPLRSAISVVNIESRDYLEHLSIDNWNYLFFGDDNSIKNIESIIREKCRPRKIIGYGTGLSTTIIWDDFNLKENIRKILKSITANAGNECDGTDIIYIQEGIYETAWQELFYMAREYRSGNPFKSGSIGLVDPDNVQFIMGELTKRGKLDWLQQTEKDGRPLIHASIIPLNEYETAMEYPGPIASVRSFKGLDHLSVLIKKDLRDNHMNRNLVTAVFARSRQNFQELIPHLKAYTVKFNKDTNEFNIALAHQGVFLVRELMDPVYVDDGIS
jgi:acyl-CoA reductase-like NAD-dependent aldehyde dehydrogenase